MDISAIQQELKDRSYDPGEIDGIWGRKTIAAVKSFQVDHGLEVDGVVGPLTSQALFGQPAAAASRANTTALVCQMKRLADGDARGVRNGSNQTILDWAADLDLHYPNDDIPWCGLSSRIASALL